MTKSGIHIDIERTRAATVTLLDRAIRLRGLGTAQTADWRYVTGQLDKAITYFDKALDRLEAQDNG